MSYSNWKSRDVARITGLTTLQNVLNMARDEEIETRQIVKYWQQKGGISSFDEQIALIQRSAASRAYVKFFVYRLGELNHELLVDRYPDKETLIRCISEAIKALQNAIAESSYIRENVKNRSVIEALRSGTVVDSGEQYFLPNKKEEYSEEDEDQYEIEPI